MTQVDTTLIPPPAPEVPQATPPPAEPADQIHQAIQTSDANAHANGPKVLDVTTGQGGDMNFADIAASVDAAKAMGKTTQPKAPDAPAEQPAQATGTVGTLLSAANSQLGVKYVYGGSTWGQALDCSSFVQGAYRAIGIELPRVTYDQVKTGTAVNSIEEAKPGDLVFVTGDIGMRANGHVGIYLGGGKWIAAPHTGTVVQVQDVPKNITAIRREI